MTNAPLPNIEAGFHAYAEKLSTALGHADKVEPFQAYCTGLLLPVERKSVEPMAAHLDGTTIKVFIELRDINYPGATYNLTYDPVSDQLRGVYFQPALQQKYDIFFIRMK